MAAGSAGAVIGGLPSTVHALFTHRDPLEATLAAGTLLLPHERRRGRLLLAAALTHGSISLLWGLILAAVLPRRHVAIAGAAGGLVIAALDLGLVGRRIPRVRRLPLGPQVADHVLYGAVVGAVLARRDGPVAGAAGRRTCLSGPAHWGHGSADDLPPRGGAARPAG